MPKKERTYNSFKNGCDNAFLSMPKILKNSHGAVDEFNTFEKNERLRYLKSKKSVRNLPSISLFQLTISQKSFINNASRKNQ